MISNSPPVFPRRAFSFAKASPVYGFRRATFHVIQIIAKKAHALARRALSAPVLYAARRQAHYEFSLLSSDELSLQMTIAASG
jgi:hypothetical protein